MPITPNAPDYATQVRAVISDLRDNSLKKGQLYLQEQEQLARIRLQEAQLQLQAENSAREASLAAMRIAASNTPSFAGGGGGARSITPGAFSSYAAQEMAKVQADVQQKQYKADLDERKFQLDLWKEQNKQDQEQRERDQELAAGRLLQEGLVALGSDDKTKLIEWTNKMGAAVLGEKTKNDVYTNVFALVEAKRTLEQQGVNIRTQPKALDIVQKLNMLDVSDYLPNQLADVIKKSTDDFKALGNNDPTLNDLFMSVSQEVAKRNRDFRQKDVGQALNTFLRTAERGELPPEDQAAWVKLNERYPVEADRLASKDYSDETNRLMYQSNKKKSIAQLQSWEQENKTRSENLAIKNDAMAAIKTDPETGEKYKVATFPVPNLTPNEYLIDPDTGQLTKYAQDLQKKWRDESTSPSFLFGAINFAQQMMAQAGTSMRAATPEDRSIPFKYESGSSFETVQIPGQTRIPAAPSTVQAAPPPPPDVVAKIVTLYNSNPEATYNGVSVREILARFRSANVPLPGLIAAPEKPR